MLQSMNWEAVDSLARSQWRMYADLGDEMRIAAEDRRRVLLLDQRQWTDWEGFLGDGPLPAEPPLPVMLRRLGRASHHLALLAERQGVSA
jgi:hypothetical protein